MSAMRTSARSMLLGMCLWERRVVSSIPMRLTMVNAPKGAATTINAHIAGFVSVWSYRNE